AKMLNDAASTAIVERMFGSTHHMIGNQAKAVAHYESAMMQNPGPQRSDISHLGFDFRILALAQFAKALWLTGQPDRAVDVARYTIHEAEGLQQPLSLSLALLFAIPVF